MEKKALEILLLTREVLRTHQFGFENTLRAVVAAALIEALEKVAAGACEPRRAKGK